MNSRRFFLFLAALLSLITPQLMKGQPKPTMDKVFTISSTTASFEAEGGTKVFTITSSGSWKISSGTQSWSKLTRVGKTLSLSVDPNLEATDRTDSFTLSSEGKTIRVTITQKGQPALAVTQPTSLSVSSEKLTFNASGGSQTITVTSNEPWSIGTTTASWGHLTSNGNKLTVRVDSNSSSSKRTDWFTVKAGGKEKRVNIEQRPISSSTATTSSTSKSTTTSKPSSTSTTSSSANKSAISSVSISNNADVDGLKGVRVRVSFNVVGMKDKSGTVSCYFYDSDGNALIDKNDNYGTVDSPPHVAVSRSFKPTSDNATYTDFDIAIPYEELHLSGTSSRTLKVNVLIWDKSVSPNKQVVRRDGVSFTCIPVVSFLRVGGSTADKTQSFSSSGGRQYYSVDTNASDFELWGVPSWCSVEKSSNGFTLICRENPSSSSRDDYMKVKAADKEIKISITQSGNYSSYSSSSSSSSRSTSGSGYTRSRTRSYSKPWLRIGIDGSMDVIMKRTQTTFYDPYYDEYYTDYTEEKAQFVFGAGLRVRIGRPDQMFNIITGARYMFGTSKGLQVPAILNWNLLRGDGIAMYMGGGYEFGVTDAYQGTGAALVQVGVGGTHGDLQVFYKPNQDLLGVGFTLYF